MEKNKRGLRDKAIICHCVAESEGLPLLNIAVCSKFFETDPLPKELGLLEGDMQCSGWALENELEPLEKDPWHLSCPLCHTNSSKR